MASICCFTEGRNSGPHSDNRFQQARGGFGPIFTRSAAGSHSPWSHRSWHRPQKMITVCHFMHVFLIIWDRECYSADVIIRLTHHDRMWVLDANIRPQRRELSPPSGKSTHLCHLNCGARKQEHTPDGQSSKAHAPSQHQTACAHTSTRKSMLHHSITPLVPMLVLESPWGHSRAWA